MTDIAGLNLNVEEEAKGMNDFSVLPGGEYKVVITEASMKENKNGAGAHIGVTMQVIEGDCDGRLLFANYNVQNANDQAEKIGRAELAALCKAIGIMSPKDTEELKDIPFIVKVGLDRKDPTRNKIKAYMPAEAEATPAPVTTDKKTTPPPAATKPAAGAKKPWQKK